jgi:hypothetical protein
MAGIRQTRAHTFATGRGRDPPWPGPNLVYDRVLEPGHPEVHALGENLVADTADPVEDDSTMTTINCKSSACYIKVLLCIYGTQ